MTSTGVWNTLVDLQDYVNVYKFYHNNILCALLSLLVSMKKHEWVTMLVLKAEVQQKVKVKTVDLHNIHVFLTKDGTIASAKIKLVCNCHGNSGASERSNSDVGDDNSWLTVSASVQPIGVGWCSPR